MSLLRGPFGEGSGARGGPGLPAIRVWRSFSDARWALCLAMSLALILGGCSKSSEASGDTPGAGAGPNEPPSEETIDFFPSEPLSLAPSELAALTVRVTPLRLQNVSFELLSESTYFDGFIIQAESRVREDGTATVEIQAPSRPSVFRVRASLSEGSVAVRTVSVSSQGYGAIEVIPSYGGSRVIRQWTASAHVNTTCSALSTYWEDGPLVATGATRVSIQDVPLGVPIALTVRGGPLVVGCATLSGVRADDVEEVTVQVTDRAVDVENGRMEVSLGVTSSTTGFAAHLDAAISLGPSFFRAGLDSDGGALLDLMAESLGSNHRGAFRQTIENLALSDVVTSIYGETQPISQAIRGLLTSAGTRISGDPFVLGELELEGSDSTMRLTDVAGAHPEAAGFIVESNWIVGAEAPDIVVVSGTLTYTPLKWLHAIAEASAVEGALPIDILSSAARCEEVGLRLVEEAQGPPFGQCDADCLSDLCVASLDSLWDDLWSVEDPVASLQVGLSGAARLYGAARIESFEGTWVGRLGSEAETSIAGAASGQLILDE